MDATEVLIDIRKIVRSINLESKRIQKDYGVSIPQVLFLNYLYQSPGFQSTQGELKKFLQLNPSTISGIVNRLERKGLIARLPKLGDKRVTNLALTAQGEKLLKQIPALLHDRLSIKLQNLPIYDLEQIKASLRMLVNILQIDNIEASPLLTTDELT